MFNIVPWELGLILLVALIVVGPGKLPEVAKAVGKGMNEFKKAANGYKREFQEAIQEMDATQAREKAAQSPVPPAQTIEEMSAKFDAIVNEKQPNSGSEAPEPANNN